MSLQTKPPLRRLTELQRSGNYCTGAPWQGAYIFSVYTPRHQLLFEGTYTWGAYQQCVDVWLGVRPANGSREWSKAA